MNKPRNQFEKEGNSVHQVNAVKPKRAYSHFFHKFYKYQSSGAYLKRIAFSDLSLHQEEEKNEGDEEKWKQEEK